MFSTTVITVLRHLDDERIFDQILKLIAVVIKEIKRDY